MKISAGKIIAALLVVYLVFTGVKSIGKRKANNSAILKEVTLVQDGKLDSQNEGKLVLVSGSLSLEKFLELPELNNPVNTFKVERKVEEFVKTTDKNGNVHYDWEERCQPKDYPSCPLDTLVTETITVPVKVGDFDIDQKGLSKLPARDNFSNFDIPVIEGLEWNGLNYSNPAHKDNDYVGDVTLDYYYYDMGKYPEVSILARQSSSSFVPYNLGKSEIYEIWPEKIDSLDKLSKKLAGQVKSEGKNRFIFIAIIVVIAVLLLVSSNKNKVAVEKGESEAAAGEKADKAEERKVSISEEAEVTAGENNDHENQDSSFDDQENDGEE